MIKKTFMTLSFLAYSSLLLADDSVAKVIKVEGEANALNAKNEARALTRGADIFPQDTIVTTPTGFATIRFSDGTVIDLAAGSKYVIHDYHFDEKDPQKDKFSSQIVEGGFRAITGTIGQRSPTAFEAKAHLTTLTVRGTYFYMMTPECPHTPDTKPMPCFDVTEFTINGKTAINYNGKEYVTGEGQPNTTFNLTNGNVTLSNKIPSKLPVKYSSSTTDFHSQIMAAPISPSTGPKNPSGGGGGGGQDPCGTLNAVGNALPNTKP